MLTRDYPTTSFLANSKLLTHPLRAGIICSNISNALWNGPKGIHSDLVNTIRWLLVQLYNTICMLTLSRINNYIQEISETISIGDVFKLTKSRIIQYEARKTSENKIEKFCVSYPGLCLLNLPKKYHTVQSWGTVLLKNLFFWNTCRVLNMYKLIIGRMQKKPYTHVPVIDNRCFKLLL